ncbi:multiheme c-type cytochrome [Sedimentitalea arenosa]|uniref:Tetratricopeptide repeat protein n=1 Tax=Sedimentitalea arenosa TaxID=2798803 RepID=A0A8J7LWH0_9RHOB|nr:multiheme c-type cytochrome [Arenibacterium arenosum]MBJ6372201.1 tetratricopeptide repeat protein [Arenibacterium arenosum]
MRATSIILAIALFCLPLSGALAQQDDRETPAYVGSESCAGCHKGETEAWMGSHHQLAWTPPDADHVLGDFNDTSFTLNGVTTRFTTRDGQFFIQSDGPDGEITTWPVAGVAGIAPLQQYLIETEPGKVQSFDVVWDVEQRRWYHLYPDQSLMADDSFHWTGPYKNWNARCAECHATGFEKAYDPASESYSSTQAEIGVGCESCHGPGEAHRDWALANGTYDPDRWAGLSDSALTMDFTAGAEAQIQQCAGCHSRREAFLDGNPLPGTPYHDAYRLSPLRPGLYHPDGQILDEVYVYGSFLQSRMYAEGVACTDCHDPHTAQRIAEDNTLCTQCHSPAGNERFPTLKLAEYDDPSHHFHPTGSEGAQCKTCHMIERDYMGIDGRRDHSFRVPRPDLTVETRAPNACTDCHADQTAKWAADRVAEWYPEGRHTQPHFGQVMAAGRIDTVGQIEGLLGIALHDGLPAIVRASAMDLLAPVSSPAIAAETEPALSDPDPQVRVAAVALQRGAPQTDLAQRLVPLLSDPVRAVRIATAREFLALRIAHMPADTTAALNSAMTEWQRSIRNKMDFPEMQMVMGGIGLTTRNMMAALSAFGEAVDMDPQMIEAWTMIVRIHAALGNRDAALAALDEAIAANPDEVSLSLMRADLAE